MPSLGHRLRLDQRSPAPHWLERLPFKRWMSPPPDLPVSDAKLFSIRLAASVIEGLVHLGLSLLFWFLDETWLVWLNLASALVFLASIVAIRKGRQGLGVLLAVGEITLHLPAMTLLLGAKSGYLLYVVGFPLTAIMELRPADRWARRLLVGYTLAMPPAVLLLAASLGPLAPIAPWKVDILFYLNICGSLLAVSFISAYFGAASEQAEKLLEAERERADALLTHVLPGSIAERLKRDPGTIAEGHADVTVLFADLVGFTPLAAALPSERVVQLLDEVFSEFDRLAEVRGVEKIKTIGDAYMAVAGVPTARLDHAQAAADLALDLLDALPALRQKLGVDLDLRIGLHTGPVVAGVIGVQKFAYDLWGDTVNVASRMESHGMPGKVQLTLATAGRLGDGYRLEPRGKVSIKGKGEVDTAFLLGRQAARAVA